MHKMYQPKTKTICYEGVELQQNNNCFQPLRGLMVWKNLEYNYSMKYLQPLKYISHLFFIHNIYIY